MIILRALRWLMKEKGILGMEGTEIMADIEAELEMEQGEADAEDGSRAAG